VGLALGEPIDQRARARPVVAETQSQLGLSPLAATSQSFPTYVVMVVAFAVILGYISTSHKADSSRPRSHT